MKQNDLQHSLDLDPELYNLIKDTDYLIMNNPDNNEQLEFVSKKKASELAYGFYLNQSLKNTSKIIEVSIFIAFIAGILAIISAFLHKQSSYSENHTIFMIPAFLMTASITLFIYGCIRKQLLDLQNFKHKLKTQDDETY